jgi:hypothetical protein
VRIKLLLPLAVAVAALGVGIGLAVQKNVPVAHPIALEAQFESAFRHITSFHALIARLRNSSIYHAPTSELAPQPGSLTPSQKAQQRCLGQVDRYDQRAAAIPTKTWKRAKLPPQHLNGDNLCV